MNLVKLLSQDIINKIASGEVIRRPSSIIRELMENSIDANANKIDIFIKDYGKDFIQLLDNGFGMNINDAKMSIKRYSTSKIKIIDDIYNINTKGFRGEALFSISMISQLEIQTKSEKDLIGIHLFIEDGKIKKEIPINMKVGTRISVKNIFYKVPSIKNFLKSSRIEYNNIIKEFYKIVISHREITYRFYHNNRIVFFFDKVDKNYYLENIVKRIFKIKKEFKYLFIKEKDFLIKGIISKPDNFEKKGYQFLFINQRFIKNIFFHKNIIQTYKYFVKNIKTISYFIFIYINPKFINWNVHPEKKDVQIEIEKKKFIGKTIKNEIKNIFGQYEIKNCRIINRYKSPSSRKRKENKKKEIDILLENKIGKIEKDYFNKSINYFLKKYFTCYEKIKAFQINNNKYIVATNEYKTILIDQHRAHKKILSEFFLKKQISVNFSNPIKKVFMKRELVVIKKLQRELKKLGFSFFISNFNSTTDFVYFKSIPKIIKESMLKKIFNSIYIKYELYFFPKKNRKNEEIISDLISDFFSIKNGEKLNLNQMKKLIKKLFFCKNPFSTFLGEPIFFFFSKKFFKKFF